MYPAPSHLHAAKAIVNGHSGSSGSGSSAVPWPLDGDIAPSRRVVDIVLDIAGQAWYQAWYGVGGGCGYMLRGRRDEHDRGRIERQARPGVPSPLLLPAAALATRRRCAPSSYSICSVAQVRRSGFYDYSYVLAHCLSEWLSLAIVQATGPRDGHRG